MPRCPVLVDGRPTPLRIAIADSWPTRARGLLGRAVLADDDGLLIVPCASVHTCFMSFAIDVVFLARDFRVLRIVPALGSWRMSGCGGAHATLELAAGAAAALGISAGSLLTVSMPTAQRTGPAGGHTAAPS